MMNLDDKLKLAQGYLRDIISNWEYDSSFDPVAESWQYADAMEKQYNQRKPSGFPDALITENSPQLEFQVDWSQAPKDALYWCKSELGAYYWMGIKGNPIDDAPSFNYQGDRKDSLRKRPEEVKEQVIPDGYVLVPRVPSERMVRAVRQCYEGEHYLAYSLYSEFINQAIIERIEAQEQ